VEVGLPAAGRRILGNRAADLLTGEIPAIAGKALAFRSLPEGAAESFVNAVENHHHLRSQLEARSLAAFVPDGAVLPRGHGASERPLTDGVVPFESPASLRVSLSLLHPGDGPREIHGMGIPEGVTLIVGGGFHGKSTLLQALARSVVPHVPGDGRELVVTRGDAVTIRAEEGRAVSSVDVSPFIRELPGGRPTTAFTTDNASGSTSQAASIVEALEAGSRLLLMDEDTSATNLMIRDARMQALVAREAEPIVALLDRVRELFEDHSVSTILVMGGSGDYLDAADTVIQLADYRPREVTAQAREVAARYPTRRSPDAGAAGFHGRERCPEPGSFDPAGRKGTPRIRATRRPDADFDRHSNSGSQRAHESDDDVVVNDRRDLGSDFRHRVRGRAPGKLVGERRAEVHHLLLRDAVPDRKKHLFAADRSRDQPVELVRRPALAEERVGKHHDSEPTARDATIYRLPEAGANPQLELVEPDVKPLLLEGVRERTNDVVLVLGRVRDEHIEDVGGLTHLGRLIPYERGDGGQRRLLDPRERARRRPHARPDRAPQSGHVDGDVPVARIRNRETQRRPRRQSSGVSVTTAALVAGEVRAVQQTHVGGAAGEVHFDDLSGLAVTKVVVGEPHAEPPFISRVQTGSCFDPPACRCCQVGASAGAACP